MTKGNRHTGSTFDDFLKEEGIFDEVQARALKREAAASLLLAAENSYGAAVDSYRSGIATFLDVSNAQAGLTRARIADAQTHAEVLATAAALAFSTGDIAPDYATGSPPPQRR